MSTRSRTITKEALSVDSVSFSDESSNEIVTDFLRGPIWKTSRGYRVDFGETDPSVQFRCLDHLPANLIEFDSVATSSCEEGKIIFSDEQKAALEAKFRTEKYPTRKGKAKLATKLGVGIHKVQNWFINRRRKWRKKQKKGAVGLRPVLPEVSLTQTSCKRSFKSSVGFGCYPQFPAQRHEVQPQPLHSAPFLAAAPFGSASHHVTQSFQSFTARSSGPQLYLQQPLPASSPPYVTETERLPYHQAYLPFPGPLERFPQQQLETNRLVQQTAASSYLAHHPLPPVNPVEPDFHQLPAADSRRLTDEFPFSYSIAKELPHIFGNLEDDEVLNRPLTPSFEPPAQREPWWDTMALQSDLYHSSPASLTKEDFTDNASPNYRHVQPSNFNSCCFGSRQMLSPPPLRELSCGLISKGRSFSFYRQD